jgi:two-component system, chemotaxis family, protein-glutamate methylesterase/glutaminase
MPDRSVFIGSSMNGIEVLQKLVRDLPADFPAPIFVAQHVGRNSPGYLPDILTRAGRRRAVPPRDGERIACARIYVAPPDRHMLVEDGAVRLSDGPQENHVRPAVDPLFRSAALAYGPAAIGVVLTGQLDDGTAGLLAIKDCGGTALVQDPAEAPAPSMPLSALRHVPVDHCLPVSGLAEKLVELARDNPAGEDEAPDRGLLRIEHRIASGAATAEDWRALEQRSIATGLRCPQCGSALDELPDRRFVRLRCRSGHAYSQPGLSSVRVPGREAPAFP